MNILEKLLDTGRIALSWMSRRIRHKLEHLSLTALKDTILDGGLALLIIVLVWEIVEDVMFPLLFGFLGSKVHPIFYAMIPASWLLCLHWLAVPILWSVWTKFKKK